MIAPTDGPDLVATLRALLGAGRYRDVVASWLAAPDAEARQSDALLLAATASMRLGDVTRAGELAAEAAEGFRLRADQDGRLRAVNLLGAVAFERGELQEAMNRFETARGLARQLDDTLFEAHAANNLASVAHLRGDAALALSLYRVALLAYQRLGDRRGTAQTYHNLGLAFRELGALADADEATVQAVRHARMEENGALAAIAVTGRAELDIARGALDVATRELDRATELAVEAGDAIGVAEIGRVRSEVALRRNAPEVALEEARRAGGLATEHGSALLAAECAAAEALALLRLERRDEAMKRREQATEGFTRLGAVAHAARLSREWEA
jgi:tetratricopeptide (TPR) repeat protein